MFFHVDITYCCCLFLCRMNIKRPITHISKSPPTTEDTMVIVLSLPVSVLYLDKPDVELLKVVVDEVEVRNDVNVELSEAMVKSVGPSDVTGCLDGFVLPPDTKI